MDDSCKEMATFITRTETLQFEVILFGLINTPATFQRIMDDLLKELYFCRIYLDDVVIYSRSSDNYLVYLVVVSSLISKHCP